MASYTPSLAGGGTITGHVLSRPAVGTDVVKPANLWERTPPPVPCDTDASDQRCRLDTTMQCVPSHGGVNCHLLPEYPVVIQPAIPRVSLCLPNQQPGIRQHVTGAWVSGEEAVHPFGECRDLTGGRVSSSQGPRPGGKWPPNTSSRCSRVMLSINKSCISTNSSVRTLFNNLQGKGSEAGDKLSPARVAGPFLGARALSTAPPGLDDSAGRSAVPVKAPANVANSAAGVLLPTKTPPIADASG